MTVRTRLINRRYRLERRVSLTDTTESWLGFDNVLHRAVSVTMPRQELLRDGSFLVQFLQRSRIATALHHRGIVAAFDSGEDGDTPYLVTEYLGGDSLSAIIRAESPFDVDDVAILIEQLGAALDYAHQRGFVHGQLVPDQVVVDSQGVAKLLGLGVPTGTDPTLGSRTPFSADGDIAALGAIAFEMLTGEEPDAVDGDSSGEAYLISPDVPRGASDVVAIALGAGTVRFSSAGAFARSLTGWRSFDPGDFFVAQHQAISWEAEDRLPRMTQLPANSSEVDLIALANEQSVAQAPIGRRSSSRNRWLLAAVFALMIAAGVLVWQSSEPTITATSEVAEQVMALAQLSGF